MYVYLIDIFKVEIIIKTLIYDTMVTDTNLLKIVSDI